MCALFAGPVLVTCRASRRRLPWCPDINVRRIRCVRRPTDPPTTPRNQPRGVSSADDSTHYRPARRILSFRLRSESQTDYRQACAAIRPARSRGGHCRRAASVRPLPPRPSMPDEATRTPFGRSRRRRSTPTECRAGYAPRPVGGSLRSTPGRCYWSTSTMSHTSHSRAFSCRTRWSESDQRTKPGRP